jgi:hypothetical protein
MGLLRTHISARDLTVEAPDEVVLAGSGRVVVVPAGGVGVAAASVQVGGLVTHLGCENRANLTRPKNGRVRRMRVPIQLDTDADAQFWRVAPGQGTG